MKNNLKSIEFCFEMGDGITLDVDRFALFDITPTEISFTISEENNLEYYDEWSGWNILFDRLLKNDVTQIFTYDMDKVRAVYFANCGDEYGKLKDYMNTYIDGGNLVSSIKVVSND